MSKRKRRWSVVIILLFVAAAFSLLLIFHRPKPPEPIYAGKTFSEWFNEAEKMTYIDARADYVTAIRAMGTNAVPLLAERIHSRAYGWDEFWWRHYQGLPASLKRMFSPPDRPQLREETAAVLFFETRLPADSVAPILIATYDHAYLARYQLPSVAHVDWAAELLHPPAAVLAGGAQAQSEGILREYILLTLARDGGNNKEIIPLILASAHESANISHLGGFPDSFRRDNGNLTNAIRLARPTLILALNDPASAVRAAAADFLRLNAADHPEIIAPLLKSLSDPDATVRQNAFLCLKETHLDLETYLPVYDRLMAGSFDGARGNPTMLLMHTAGGFLKLERGLEHALGSTNAAVRAAAADALGSFGSRFAAAAPKLREHTNDSAEPDERVRHAAEEALKKIETKPSAQSNQSNVSAN